MSIEVGVCLHSQIVAEAPFIALAHLSAPDLLAAASTDRVVYIFDTRTVTSKPTLLTTSALIVPQTRGHIHHTFYAVEALWKLPNPNSGYGKMLGSDIGAIAADEEDGLDIWRLPGKEEKT